MAWRPGNRLHASWLLATGLCLSLAGLPPASLPPPPAHASVLPAADILPSQPLSLNKAGVLALLKTEPAVSAPPAPDLQVPDLKAPDLKVPDLRAPAARAQVGKASWYGPGFHGKKTASGTIFDQNALSAAHPTLKLNSLVRVTNLENGASVVVKITDRGPFKKKRVIDLSRQAAKQLGFLKKGTARVSIVVLRDGTG